MKLTVQSNAGAALLKKCVACDLLLTMPVDGLWLLSMGCTHKTIDYNSIHALIYPLYLGADLLKTFVACDALFTTF